MKHSLNKNYLRKVFSERILFLLFLGFVSVASMQAQMTITGTVTDSQNEPMTGISVILKNTTKGTITDLDGTYSITVPDNKSVLVYSFISYKTKEVVVGTQRVINIKLEDDAAALDEVIVVGYGTQKKVNLTGAVTQVDSKIFETRPVTSVAGALQGAMAGVNIAPSSGNPNDDISFNVRGTTSINGGGPLVLVDGVEMNLKLINPNDIENVTVLKDAAAASIYGVRAAFGVILVTTKKGKSEGLTINYNGNFSLSKATILPEFVDNSYDHATFVNGSLQRENISPMYNDEQMTAIKAYRDNPGSPNYFINKDGAYVANGYVDWMDMLIRDTNPKQRHNLSVSGGSGKTRFFASGGYIREEGVLSINPDIFQRVNTRLSVENQTYDWMKLGFKVLFNASNMNEPHKYKDDIWQQIVFSSPIRPVIWNGDPAYPQYDKFTGMYFDDQNAIPLLELGGRNKLKEEETVLSPSIDLNPIKGWNIHVDFSYSKSGSNKTYHRKRVDMITSKFIPTTGNTNNDSYQVFNSDKEYYSFNAFTDYEKTFAKKHYFKGMVGYNQELTSYTSTTSTRKNLLSQDLPSLSLGTGEQTVEETGYQWALRGGFARVNYSYDNRYLLELNGRYDGTSRFPKDDRFVFLPSFSAAWRLSEEKFMDFSKSIFDNIKIRGSYGKLGNQLLTSSSWVGNTKYYPYIPFLSNGLTNNYLFGSAVDILMNPAGITTRDLTWEESKTINGGLDLTLFSSRLDMSFDVYRRTTSRMLISQEFPEVLGASAPVANRGELQTNGWELSVKWRDRIGKDFSYDLGIILFDSQAKITRYDGPKGTVDSYYVGKKIGEIWGFETEGIFQSDEEAKAHPVPNWGSNWTAGDIKYKDLNGDEKITKGANTLDDYGDLKVIGNETARYNYGLTAGASYKGIFLNMFFQGVGKRDFWPSAQAFWPVSTQYFNTQKWFFEDSWSEDNRDAYFAIPRARNTKNEQKQTRYLQDGSYIRLKNFTVGYDLPASWINKVKLSKAQIYFSGENMWEHSKVKGPYDPESAAKNGTMAYPFQRTYSIGIDLTF
ncbi:TonB-linked SusC/RagA family outer membrane protein [Dysgonomonas alginatilytica]|uniref:TonB-linked SusC/RagA family outer membrane protein n=1 Tax=Dysgonomonas alginatilytica TaxID=1605892 RepID=A0A2V3PU28_9BACT|nr:TonB-dependent receptor [Dysgonomonas alginatilytica]PXV69119.1 TonB-linked SusC/RagA family outer membrane protein [Dysgonomonas alginatilytica]